jgi:hypothetical protein
VAVGEIGIGNPATAAALARAPTRAYPGAKHGAAIAVHIAAGNRVSRVGDGADTPMKFIVEPRLLDHFGVGMYSIYLGP